ncbi:MAG: tetratricopeptide repeat protein [Desulfobacterota bacterium]|nr:tetratricopeptide repeat protein [Thermodesulfobacteriota bacterium]
MTDKIEGVFLLEKDAKIGTGHTEKKVKQRMYCLAHERDDGMIEYQYLGANDEPLDIVETMPKAEFIHQFTFQPYYFERKQAEQQKKINKHIALAEEHVRRKELYSAEYEYKNALKLDEENLRANFGIGNVYLQMGEKEKAKEIFVKISTIDAIFEEHNKHFFNECGIQLRKQELYDEAIRYYQKALSLSPQDEHLLFNLARALFEKGDYEQARETIYQALIINPEFKEAQVLLSFIEQKKTKEDLRRHEQSAEPPHPT